MKFKIGFSAEPPEAPILPAPITSRAPVKSVVQVHFPDRSMTLAYFNDLFDLHCGDLVYVDGKLEGLRGQVVGVTYNFKIKISDYQRVIGLADTDVRGTFHLAGSHLVTFDPEALPFRKVRTWFLAPDQEDAEYACGNDDTSFRLDDPGGMHVSSAIAERGQKYYVENRVSYLSIHGTQGRAIVEGSQPYAVEFEYRAGSISNLVCSCFCSYPCKHEVAAMLQLRELLELAETHHVEEFSRTGCFSAVSKATFFSVLLSSREAGSITLG